jgi:hypothetical protein
MTTDTSFLEREIATERQSLEDNLHELEVKARAATDWRVQFRQRPWVALGLVACGGALLSELGRSNHSTTRQPSFKAAGGDGTAIPRPRTHTDETWDRIKGALLVAAVTQAAGLVRESFPGFHDMLIEGMRVEGGNSPKVGDRRSP